MAISYTCFKFLENLQCSELFFTAITQNNSVAFYVDILYKHWKWNMEVLNLNSDNYSSLQRFITTLSLTLGGCCIECIIKSTSDPGPVFCKVLTGALNTANSWAVFLWKRYHCWNASQVLPPPRRAERWRRSIQNHGIIWSQRINPL